MKKFLYIFLVIILFLLTNQNFSIAQNKTIDSLLKVVVSNKLTDTGKADVLNSLCSEYYSIGEYSKGLQYGNEGLLLSQKVKYKKGEANCYINIGNIYESQSDYSKALDCFNKALKIHKQLGNKTGISISYTNIGLIYMDQSDYPKALEYYQQSLRLDEELKDTSGIAVDYNNIGNIYLDLSDYPKAMEYDLKSLKLCEQLNDRANIANNYYDIGKIYESQSDYPKALDYRFKSLKIYETLGDKAGMAKNYKNIGNVYADQSENYKALDYYFKSLKLYEELGDKAGSAKDYTNIGIIYMELSNYSKSLEYNLKSLKIDYELADITGLSMDYNNIGDLFARCFQKDSLGLGLITTTNEHISHVTLLDSALFLQKKALAINKQVGDKQNCIASLKGIADAYFYKQNYKDAIIYYQQSYFAADTLGALSEKNNAAKGLSDSYKKLKDWEKAYIWYETYTNGKDSVFSSEKNKEIAGKELKFDYDRKTFADSVKSDEEKKIISAQLKQEQIKSYALYGGLALVLVFAGFMFNRFKVTQKQKEIITKEKHRSDELLLNILPEEVAEELKTTGLAKAKHFNEVSVLFTDFKGFTAISEHMDADELVAELHQCFSAFDKITQKYGLEKIKTIGDSYMCVSGLPRVSEESAVDAVRAALAICKFMKKHNDEKRTQGKELFEIRIGIHSGPVVAGIVGFKKFAYDIWGDTVNTASRMESSGEPGKVNISGTTYQLVKEYFKFTYRGKIHVKNKGEIEMYFVET